MDPEFPVATPSHISVLLIVLDDRDSDRTAELLERFSAMLAADEQPGDSDRGRSEAWTVLLDEQTLNRTAWVGVKWDSAGEWEDALAAWACEGSHAGTSDRPSPPFLVAGLEAAASGQVSGWAWVYWPGVDPESPSETSEWRLESGKPQARSREVAEAEAVNYLLTGTPALRAALTDSHLRQALVLENSRVPRPRF